ncbi:hypothetical protein KM043_014842 [Ampulex compressa]|nr:hypothetical protein KM043_014842 [Ampulex compressa]
MAARESGRIKDAYQKRVLDDAARKRRQKKALEALEQDNFHDDPHADLVMSKKVPKFQETLDSRGGGRKKKTRSAEYYKQRFRKTFGQLVEEDLNVNPNPPNYASAQAAPSRFPERQFCAVKTQNEEKKPTLFGQTRRLTEKTGASAWREGFVRLERQQQVCALAVPSRNFQRRDETTYEWRRGRDLRSNYRVPLGAITMTTLDSQSDKSLCHLDKLSSAELAEIPSECGFPVGMRPLESQVAGHPFNDKKYTISMLRGPNGHVLKPVTKPLLGKREIAFYENLRTTEDPLMLQLRNCIPKYYGTTDLQISGRRVTFLTLKDITDGMAEPCVMDIKIGRRTWDPLATPQKKATEELKYAESKRTYGFCITGFQVYDLSSGQLKTFGKDYGKTLDAKGVVEALKIFLNISPERPACRQLIVKLLSLLWKILLFFRTQRIFRFYSSSLLVAYDARRLRYCLRMSEKTAEAPANRTARSFPSANSRTIPSNVFKDATSEAPANHATISALKTSKLSERTSFLKRSVSLCTEHEITEEGKILNRSGSCGPDLKTDRLCRTHSYVNNFDDDIIRMKEDYDALLSELSSSSREKENWVRINMIDFTHVFPAEDRNSLDLNYLEGMENLIKLVENFLAPKSTSS